MERLHNVEGFLKYIVSLLYILSISTPKKLQLVLFFNFCPHILRMPPAEGTDRPYPSTLYSGNCGRDHLKSELIWQHSVIIKNTTEYNTKHIKIDFKTMFLVRETSEIP